MHSSYLPLVIAAGQVAFLGIAILLVRHWFRRQSDPIKAKYQLLTGGLLASWIAFFTMIAWFIAEVIFNRHYPFLGIPGILILITALTYSRERHKKILDARISKKA